MFEEIVVSGSLDPFKDINYDFDNYSVSWNSILKSIIEFFINIFEEPDHYLFFQKYKQRFFKIIEYMLSYPNPLPEDEVPETATFTVGSYNEPRKVSEPIIFAINSVRGKSFELLLRLIDFDRNLNPDDYQINDSEYVLPMKIKELIENQLFSENTKALFCEYGRFTYKLFFDDNKWFKSIQEIIYPSEEKNKKLLIASWEGYLISNLYEEIFFDDFFQNLYFQGLGYSSEDDEERKFHLDPSIGVARHIALALVYFNNKLNFDSNLFIEFWKSDIKSKKEFVNFIGRHFISRKIETNKLSADIITRLHDLWDWIIENEDSSEVFDEFGFWINHESHCFELSYLVDKIIQTLEKSKGNLNWELGLTNSLETLSENYPEKTVIILKLLLLEGLIRNQSRISYYYTSESWKNIFSVLYNNPKTKIQTKSLINSLLQEGGERFWELKDIIE